MANAQQEAVKNYRNRLKNQGLVRVEIQTPQGDAPLLREVAKVLRSDPAQAAKIRAQISRVLHPEARQGLKQLLAVAPLEGIDLTRQQDFGREIDL